MGNETIDPALQSIKNWAQTLESVTTANKPTANKPISKTYIGHEYILNSNAKEKISLKDIVDHSLKELDTLKKLVKEEKITTHEFEDLTNQIMKGMSVLFKKVEAKRNLLWKVAILTSFLGIGLFIGYKLKQSEGVFKDLQSQVINLKVRANESLLIQDQINTLPQIFEEMSGFKTDEMSKTELSHAILHDRSPFEADYFRDGQNFLRKDTSLGIDDKNLQPGNEVKGEKRLEAAKESIKNLLNQDEEDLRRWEKPLQFVVSQAVHPFLFGFERGMFDAQSVGNCRWESNGNNFSLRFAFSEHTRPPVSLEIIRDENHKIKEVKCQLKANFDVESYCYEGKQEGDYQPIKKNVLEAVLEFTLSLDTNNLPYVSQLETRKSLNL